MVAIKYMNINWCLASATHVKEIYREAQALWRLDHGNIIKFYDAYLDGENLVLIIEYAKGGELYKYIKENDGISESESRTIMW